MRNLIIAACLLSPLPAAADWFPTTTDTKIRQQQEDMLAQANNAIGLPAITNFAEKRNLKQILELRDQNIATYTYLASLDGHVGALLCNSIGYPMPYATEFTNPQRAAIGSELMGAGSLALPQADPNGLFSPTAADGTWVMCLNPETKKATAIYVEPHVITSPFPLTSAQKP